MTFRKGKPKTGGRQKGTPNRLTLFRRLIEAVLEENEVLFKTVVVEMLRDKTQRQYLFSLLERLEPKDLDDVGITKLEIEYIN